MKRAFAIWVVLVAAPAHAEDRHALAVVSVVAKDAPSAKPADAITAAIRAEASGKASEYRVVGTGKEVAAATVAAECNAAEPRCAAKIGAALDAELAITGELAIVANAQQGEVLIDGQVVAGLFEGRTTIGNLVKGTHLLSIRARGYRPLEIEVTIESATKQTLLLEPR